LTGPPAGAFPARGWPGAQAAGLWQLGVERPGWPHGRPLPVGAGADVCGHRRSAEVLKRLNYFVAELKRCQTGNGNGYLGGVPGGAAAWRDIAQGKLQADNFSVNGKWVPWYNLHKMYAGLRDACHYGGNQDARAMLIALCDWTLELTSHLSEEQMQQPCCAVSMAA
jgi:DUF1680 family protein